MVNTPKKTWQVFLKDICQPMTMDFVPMMNCLGYPILLHKAAKEAFGKLDGPVPKIREINARIKEISAEKLSVYAEYRRTRDEMKELQTAKYNVEQLLGEEERGTARKHRKDRDPVL